MVLNLVSLGVFAAAFAAAVLIFVRRLPRPGAATALACVRCGAPAVAMTSFTCTGCGHDVRGMGLAPSRGRSPTGPFWAAATFTAILFLLMLLASGVVMSALPRARSFHQNVSMEGGRESPVRLLEVSVNARGQQVTVVGDLYTRDGAFVELRADGKTEQWTLTDGFGGSSESGTGLHEKMAMRWATLAGLDPADRSVRDAAIEALDEVVRLSGREPIPMSMRGAGTQFSGRSGSATSSFSPSGVLAAVLIVASAAWVSGLWLILRRPQTPARPAPATVPGAGT